MLGLQEKVVPGELAGEGLIVGTLLVVVVDEMRSPSTARERGAKVKPQSEAKAA